jgi:glycosyltransferase involved in cell wall biosynthesis
MDGQMKKKILFLGFLISKKEMDSILKEDDFPSVQTFNYTTKLVKCLAQKYKVDAISSKAVSDYPYNKKILYRSIKYKIDLNEENIDVVEIGFLNLGVLKVLTRFLSAFIEMFKYFNIFSKNRKKVDYIFVYSVHLPYMILGLFFSKVFNIKLVGVWSDPPALVNPTDSYIKRSLRGAELIICKYIMNFFKKNIVLSKHLALDFSKGSEYLVVESIFDIDFNSIFPKNFNSTGSENKIAYFGSVNECYGIKRLVQSFDLLKGLNVELHIYGSGDYSKKLEIISEKSENIKYHGFIHPKLVNTEMVKYDFLINVRSPSELFVKYSFPSKVTEYMSSGIPFISTLLPGMPIEYKNYLFPVQSESASGIAKDIKRLIRVSKIDRGELAEKAKKFISGKNIISVSEKIYHFLECK